MSPEPLLAGHSVMLGLLLAVDVALDEGKTVIHDEAVPGSPRRR